MVTLEESRVTRLAKERRTGPEGKPSSQKSPWRAVVGSRPGVGPHWQPGQYDPTHNFCTFFFHFSIILQCFFNVSRRKFIFLTHFFMHFYCSQVYTHTHTHSQTYVCYTHYKCQNYFDFFFVF